jgi:hypothetical protein
MSSYEIEEAVNNCYQHELKCGTRSLVELLRNFLKSYLNSISVAADVSKDVEDDINSSIDIIKQYPLGESIDLDLATYLADRMQTYSQSDANYPFAQPVKLLLRHVIGLVRSGTKSDGGNSFELIDELVPFCYSYVEDMLARENLSTEAADELTQITRITVPCLAVGQFSMDASFEPSSGFALEYLARCGPLSAAKLLRSVVGEYVDIIQAAVSPTESTRKAVDSALAIVDRITSRKRIARYEAEQVASDLMACMRDESQFEFFCAPALTLLTACLQHLEKIVLYGSSSFEEASDRIIGYCFFYAEEALRGSGLEDEAASRLRFAISQYTECAPDADIEVQETRTLTKKADSPVEDAASYLSKCGVSSTTLLMSDFLRLFLGLVSQKTPSSPQMEKLFSEAYLSIEAASNVAYMRASRSRRIVQAEKDLKKKLAILNNRAATGDNLVASIAGPVVTFCASVLLESGAFVGDETLSAGQVLPFGRMLESVIRKCLWFVELEPSTYQRLESFLKKESCIK